MTKYVALIRGVGPENPNMHSAKLKEFFEDLGFKNVQTLLSSGNVIFESGENNLRKIEDKIEEQLPIKLGFFRSTIIRSFEQLQKLIASDPFKGKVDAPQSRLNVTFLKKGGEIYSVIDTTNAKFHTPHVMRQLEREHGQEITMRTWKTVNRIMDKMKA